MMRYTNLLERHIAAGGCMPARRLLSCSATNCVASTRSTQFFRCSQVQPVACQRVVYFRRRDGGQQARKWRGLERAVQGEQDVTVKCEQPIGPFGTATEPVEVESIFDERIMGCPGDCAGGDTRANNEVR